MAITLKNDILASQSSLQGIYEWHKTINGKASWKSASNAVWYVPKSQSWGIGNLKKIGGETLRIVSDNYYGLESPYDVPPDKWLYREIWGWKDGNGDIIIQCKNERGKLM